MNNYINQPMCPQHTYSKMISDIMHACTNNDVQYLTQIYEYAHTLSRTPDEFLTHWVNCFDYRGYNPLMTAVYNGANDAVRYLLEEKGAHIVCGHQHGSTALHVAAYVGNVEAMKIMQEYGKSFDFGNALRTQDNWGKLPLHHVHYHQIVDGVAFLTPLSPLGIRDSSNLLPAEQKKKAAEEVQEEEDSD